MPKFESVLLSDAQAQVQGSKKAAWRGYEQYITCLGPGKAGHLTPEASETKRSLLLRLRRAAKSLGTSLAVKQVGDELYFWPESRKRGRPKKAVAQAAS